MAHSYVTHGPRSVLMHDAEITATIYYVLHVAEADPARFPENAHPWLEVWRRVDDDCASGALDLKLDTLLRDRDDVARFYALADAARAALESEPPMIDGRRLDRMIHPVEPSGFGDRSRAKMLADLDRLLSVVPREGPCP